MSLVDPERIVLGGGLGTSGGAWLDLVRRRYEGMVRPGAARIEVARLGADSGVIGAALTRQAQAPALFQRRHRQQAALPLGGAVTVEPHQSLGSQGCAQPPHHPLRGSPGQLAPQWFRPVDHQRLARRVLPLARSGRPASTRAASRMRQLSHTPQGCAPPL